MLSPQETQAVKKGGIMKKPIPIKPFKTLEEEARFWDTHDVSELMRKTKIPLDKVPLLEPEKEDVMTLRLQKSVKKKLAHIAHSKGINFSTLSRMWLIEKLREYEA